MAETVLNNPVDALQYIYYIAIDCQSLKSIYYYVCTRSLFYAYYNGFIYTKNSEFKC